MNDKVLKCIEKDCGREFVLTVGEQDFYASKKDGNGAPLLPPKRCPNCRNKRKVQRDIRMAEEAQKMENQKSSPFKQARDMINEKYDK